MPSRPDPIQLNFEFMKGKGLRTFLLQKLNNKQKLIQMWFQGYKIYPKLPSTLKMSSFGANERVMKDVRVKVSWSLLPCFQRVVTVGSKGVPAC